MDGTEGLLEWVYCRYAYDFWGSRFQILMTLGWENVWMRVWICMYLFGLLFRVREHGVMRCCSRMMTNVGLEEEVSESFSVTNRVKQGCVLAPTLFSIFLLVMLDEAFRDMGDGVYIQSRQSADLFNVTYFRAKTRILMREVLLGDDSAPVSHSAEETNK